VIGACLLAILAVLPLLVPELWVGFRVGLADTALAVIAPTEQPLSVRSPGGLWAMALALAWFGLAYWKRRFSAWETVLVLIGGAAALARLGNAWVDALAIVVPLARQLTIANFKTGLIAGLAAICLAVAVMTFVASRSPELPAAATQTALASGGRGTVLADWHWASDVQHTLGADRHVWTANGLTSESNDFWLDYLRVAQGHAHWAAILRQMHVDLLVLDAAGEQRQAAELVRASSDWRVLFDARGVLVAERISS
jgi:hypothetical protein